MSSKAIEMYKRIQNIGMSFKNKSYESYYYILGILSILSSFIPLIVYAFAPQYLLYSFIAALIPTIYILGSMVGVWVFRSMTIPIVFDLFQLKLKKEKNKCILFTIDASGMLTMKIGIADGTLKKVIDPSINFAYNYTDKDVFMFEGFPALVVYNGIGTALNPLKLGVLQQIHEMGFKSKFDFIKQVKTLETHIEKLKNELEIAKIKNKEDKIKELSKQLEELQNTKKLIEDNTQPFCIQFLNLDAVTNFISNENSHLKTLAIETALTAGMQLARRDEIFNPLGLSSMKWIIGLAFMAIVGFIVYQQFM
ncbi:hypothetical protein [Methanothermococcus sp.]|uniref:hypothetical protein n=1 Tax=Methanothermococcus sp. TaxID=2614238 RepID=UPI0025F63BD4|nr:hypothetical protein [Methanothermococcus sp.]